MLKSLGKWLQVLALILLPAAMLYELSHQESTAIYRAQTSSLALMLRLLIFGVVLFGTGRLIEGYAGGASKQP